MAHSSVLVPLIFCGLWSLTNGLEGERIQLFYSDYNKIDLVNLGSLENRTITDGLHGSLSFDYHSNKGLVFLADMYSSISVVGTTFLRERETVVRTKIGSTLGIAVDWIHDHVYWTDDTFQNVQVSTLDGGIRKSLIEHLLDQPRGIAIDAHNRILFFSDGGSSSRIERCGLDGKDRRIIVGDVRSPNGLAIDHKAQRIYWTDGSRHEIKSANFDGSGIKTVIKNSHYLPAPFGIDIYHDKVYWTNLVHTDILRADKYASYEVEKVYIGKAPTGIKIINNNIQMNFGKSVCGRSNGGCSDLCLPSAPWSVNAYTCACPDGHTLNLDGKSCYYSGRNVRMLLAEKRSISTTDIDSLEITYKLQGKDIVGVDYHYKDNLMYCSDKHLHNIFVYLLSGKSSGLTAKPILPIETFRPGNIAVDWVYDHLYWMETLYGQMHVSNLDGGHRKTLIRDLDNPSGLALYPDEGFMFFSEWGYRFGGRITRSAMDGSSKKKIIVSDIEMPLGVTIDYPARRVYWTDASLNEIKSATFEGGDVHTVIKLTSKEQPFGIAIYGDALFWSNSMANNVYAAHKYTGGDMKPFIAELKNPRHLKLASPSSQNKGSNRCSMHECDQLCLPVPLSENQKGYSCTCADNYHMIEHKCVKKESAKLVKEEL